MSGNFKWNEKAMADFEKEIGSKLGQQIDATLRRVSEEYLGKPEQEVKAGLRRHWAARVQAGPMQEPIFSQVVALISSGQHVWMQGDKIMADDPAESE
jgi:hypothetical protein